MRSPPVVTEPVPQPVFPEYFADPFVWRVGGEYFAVGTGAMDAAGETRGADRVFELLRSDDLRRWRSAGHALVRPDESLGTTYWAPEVARHEGLFYLYYSVGHGDKHHQLRVAVSDLPEGPYRDTGRALIELGDCPFAIDPHPFRDDDGRWYLFYATDFLDCDAEHRAGTALKAAPMETMTRLAGPGVTVLRARHDWQRFESDRPMYGRRFDWHTLEGPCVRKRGGRYYCFYSGGRWERESYGVDYGVADSVLGPYSDAGNEAGARVLHTLPGRLIGPGHNSIVADAGGNEHLVYHAWDPAMTARRMFVSPLLWTVAGPRCGAF